MDVKQLLRELKSRKEVQNYVTDFVLDAPDDTRLQWMNDICTEAGFLRVLVMNHRGQPMLKDRELFKLVEHCKSTEIFLTAVLLVTSTKNAREARERHSRSCSRVNRAQPQSPRNRARKVADPLRDRHFEMTA